MTLSTRSMQANHRFLQCLEDFRRTQLEALHGWDAKVRATAESMSRAKSWNDLIAAQGDLLNSGFTQFAKYQADWVSAWMSLQCDCAQGVQDQVAEALRVLTPHSAGATPV